MRINLLVAASLLAVSACATAANPVEVKPVERMTQMTPQSAAQLAANGHYREAAIAYTSALQTNPEDADARFGLAEVLRKASGHERAKAEYVKLLGKPEWKLRALEGIGRTSLAAGDRAGARDAFTQVVAEDGKAWKSWLGLAELNDHDGEWAKADEAYAMALASTDQPALIYNNQGLSRLARGDAEWAASHFRQALATDPKLTQASTNLEIAESVIGKSLQKVSASERDAKDRARKLNNAGYVAMLQNRPEEARAFFQAALETHPSFYAQAYQNMQMLEAARPKVVSTTAAVQPLPAMSPEAQGVAQ